VNRPLPPEHLREPGYALEPSLELAAWAKSTFIDEAGPLSNPDHKHLRTVDLAVVFTNVEYEDGGMPVAGMAEIVNANGKPWARAERVDHLCLMHGNIPQARVWLFAPFWETCDDASACALIEHELYHFAHKKNKEREEMYDDEDRPVLTKRAHDVGEFIPVARRYGLNAVHQNVALLVAAAQSTPLIEPAQIAVACGSCGSHL
jgi:hypothetical protein